MRKFSVILTVLVAVSLFACAAPTQPAAPAQAPAAAPATEPAAEPTDITLLLSFIHDMQNIHYYFAQDRGYLDQCGINLTLKTAAEVENPLQLLVTGEVDYALIDPFTYIAGVHRGLPIVAVGEDVARTPVAYASLAETGIEGPEDLPGHVVGLQPGQDSQWFLDIIMEQTLTEEERAKVQTVPTGFEIQPLLAGTVDAYSLWPTNSNINSLIADGQEFNLITAYEYGIDVPGNLIVTTQDTVDNHPDQVRNLLAAVGQGVLDSFQPENADAAVEAAQARIEQDVTPEVLKLIYESLWEFRQTPLWLDEGPLWNDPDAYQQTQDILLEHGEIDEAIPVDQLYNNQFLDDVFDGGQLASDLATTCSQ